MFLEELVERMIKKHLKNKCRLYEGTYNTKQTRDTELLVIRSQEEYNEIVLEIQSLIASASTDTNGCLEMEKEKTRQETCKVECAKAMVEAEKAKVQIEQEKTKQLQLQLEIKRLEASRQHHPSETEEQDANDVEESNILMEFIDSMCILGEVAVPIKYFVKRFNEYLVDVTTVEPRKPWRLVDMKQAMVDKGFVLKEEYYSADDLMAFEPDAGLTNKKAISKYTKIRRQSFCGITVRME